MSIHAAQVTKVLIRDISPNPHNPRRLFDEDPMSVLRESIEKLGILVPITVYEETRDGKSGAKGYVILDGERRWRCAQHLKFARIPSIVVERPSEERNILTMFHIHNVREGWQLMPTALKLQTLMEKLNETNERKLAELTKLSISQIRRCKILLTYSIRFQNLMLAPPTERMKADFFIELQRIRGPALSEKFPPWVKRKDSHCIEILLDKYERGVIKAVTEFRKLAEIYRACVRARKVKRFMRELGQFLDEPERTIDSIEIPGATFAKEAKEIRRTGKRFLTQLESIDLEAIAADENIVKMLRRIVKVLHSKLDQALLTGPRDVTTDNN